MLGVKSPVSAALAGRLDAPRDGGPVLVGIRPHDLELAGEQADGLTCVDGVVDISEHTGTEVFANVDVNETRVIARLPRSPIYERGCRVRLGFHTDNVVIFDESTHQSLLRRTTEREKVRAVDSTSAESQQ